mmetsp:Transcript_14723/g.48037  ORF Transcript_14723/g.48037 Transcript_14723/m.48037 type:complete len:363 (+) Transcript_14723:128-1216(+)|eukprot:CAMPEP_0118905538 /NCGR_PEP_ID=MMETSP1166-20130328/9495_1 /TAXON_ID=1104430 /ORGANISM="Chrysoreinhardia sp, Strain CCMP3193" /LENGTH=362 /DNA_ID=CAMNT_0006844809 /DNA_START=117 /DNA_END=1205 /DNA_ORIENTATION=-
MLTGLIRTLGDVVAPVQSSSHELFIAIRQRDWRRTEELLALSGVNAFGVASSFDVAPLHVACEVDFYQCVDYLLSVGADVNVRERRHQETPLHFSARSGHAGICRLLVDRGADLIARNATNQTAYDVARDPYVRQWLLPLQLHAEAQMEGSAKLLPAPCAQQFTSHNPTSLHAQLPPTLLPLPPRSDVATTSFSATISPSKQTPNRDLVPSKGSEPRDLTHSPPGQFPSIRQNPPAYVNHSMIEGSSEKPKLRHSIRDCPQHQHNGEVHLTHYCHVSKRRDASGRYADGFHSSSSDPSLAAKYGHERIRSHPELPPPPMAPIVHDKLRCSTLAQTQRYVSYDPSGTMFQAPSVMQGPTEMDA